MAVKGQGGKQGGLMEYFQFEEQKIELTFPIQGNSKESKARGRDFRGSGWGTPNLKCLLDVPEWRH